jgi:hypothetical protein
MAEIAHSEKLKQIIDCLSELDPESQMRVLRAAAVYLGVDHSVLSDSHAAHGTKSSATTDLRSPNFTQRGELPPKDFIHQKAPATDVDRVACLAYYLTHYRGTPHFKTVDISALNTEAAQLKFSNTAFAVVNAANAGLIVPAGKGQKQLSAFGEQYVEALPDRAAARELVSRMKARRRKKRERAKEVSQR